MRTLFDKMFDMNGDGKLGPLETSMKWAFIAGAVDECVNQNEDEFDTVDDDFRRTELEIAGLDLDELEWMYDDERREAIEEAGLDADDYDFL